MALFFPSSCDEGENPEDAEGTQPSSTAEIPEKSLDPLSLPNSSVLLTAEEELILESGTEAQELLLTNGQWLVIQRDGEGHGEDVIKEEELSSTSEIKEAELSTTNEIQEAVLGATNRIQDAELGATKRMQEAELSSTNQIQELIAGDQTVIYSDDPAMGEQTNYLTVRDVVCENRSKTEVVLFRRAAPTSGLIGRGRGTMEINDSFALDSETANDKLASDAEYFHAKRMKLEASAEEAGKEDEEDGMDPDELSEIVASVVDAKPPPLTVSRILVAFRCQNCGLTFFDRRRYAQHRSTAHPLSAATSTASRASNGTARCYSLAASQSLSSQDKDLAGAEKTYECRQCGKQFSLRFNLLRHVQLHTGVRQVSVYLAREQQRL